MRGTLRPGTHDARVPNGAPEPLFVELRSGRFRRFALDRPEADVFADPREVVALDEGLGDLEQLAAAVRLGRAAAQGAVVQRARRESVADAREQIVVRVKVVPRLDVAAPSRLPANRQVRAVRRVPLDRRDRAVGHDIAPDRIAHQTWILTPREIETDTELDARWTNRKPP